MRLGNLHGDRLCVGAHADQVTEVEVESAGELPEGGEGRIGRAPLDLREHGTGNPRARRQLLERQAPLFADVLQPRPKGRSFIGAPWPPATPNPVGTRGEGLKVR